MSNHTPGPWTCNDDRSITAGPQPHRHGQPGWCVIAYTTGITTPETEANARLIAASPDLLEVVRRLLRHIPNDVAGCSVSDDVRRARQAIAKALGQ